MKRQSCMRQSQKPVKKTEYAKFLADVLLQMQNFDE
jgi:hypothetical protein